MNQTRHGVAGRPLAVSGFDYGYQAPRAVSQYQSWAQRERVVAIQGWGTADTEALVRFVTRDRIPYISGSYSAALTDAGGRSGQGVEPRRSTFPAHPTTHGGDNGPPTIGGRAAWGGHTGTWVRPSLPE